MSFSHYHYSEAQCIKASLSDTAITGGDFPFAKIRRKG
jgi:hypothetical protein